jgi:hypothetical protein
MAAANTYVPLATVTTSGSQSTVTFSSISQSYTDLVLQGSTRRGTNGAGDAGWNLTFNGDTGTNYSVTMMYASGSSVASARGTNNSNSYYTAAVGDGVYCANEMNIMNYSNTSVYKSFLTRSMVYGNGSPSIDTRLFVNTWRSTAAITSITLSPASGFWDGSVITLYGILAA